MTWTDNETAHSAPRARHGHCYQCHQWRRLVGTLGTRWYCRACTADALRRGEARRLCPTRYIPLD